MNFSPLEKRLLLQFMREASETLSNASCNDLPLNINEDSPEDIKQLIAATAFDDEDRESSEEQLAERGEVYLLDHIVLDHLIEKLEATFP